MGGDFNITRSPEEKLGVTFRKGAMTDFSNFIDELELIDLPASGGKFTWSHLREEPPFSRLDHFLISPEIIGCWPSIIQQILPRGISDHNPITLSTPTSQWGPKPFKWFDQWFDDKEPVYQLKATCHKSKGNGIMTMLRQCKSASKDWRKNRLKDDPESIPSIESKCQALELEISNRVEPIANSKELKKLRSKLWLCTMQEKREWLQKSRLKWFEAGDKNTKFFHLTASARRRSNYIGSLKFGESLIYNPSEIKAAVEAHFRDMYNSSNTIPIDDINCHLNSVSPESSTRLERPFTMEEIISALSSLDGSRALGSDGFNMNFLKRFWTQLKDEILIFFEQFQKGEVRDVSFNHSFIVLLPKAKSPVSIGDYRPISLVGSIYKLLSKILTNRLKSVSEDLIGETQFAFCPGKQILDCSLISNELIDYTRKRGLQGIVFKADFRKAYDTVDWNFLLFTTRKMGFGEVWCSWIKCCISTTNISVLVNGSHTRSFSIRRGLRQGCLLSPLFFNIIAEVLSVLLRQAKSLGLFSGFHFGNSSEGISHLQFADDLITFCGANETEVKNIVRVLRVFELMSGLKLNLKRSKLLGESLVDLWAKGIHCNSELFPTIYRGLPLGQVKNDAKLWEPVLAKIRSKLKGWKTKTLSFGGRITMVKSVLANLLMYYISIFPLPMLINKIITRLGLIDFQVKNASMLLVDLEICFRTK
ncbi:hypothetical protein GQ457_12G008760 [Hibiscus cannabinus]